MSRKDKPRLAPLPYRGPKPERPKPQTLRGPEDPKEQPRRAARLRFEVRLAKSLRLTEGKRRELARKGALLTTFEDIRAEHPEMGAEEAMRLALWSYDLVPILRGYSHLELGHEERAHRFLRETLGLEYKTASRAEYLKALFHVLTRNDEWRLPGPDPASRLARRVLDRVRYVRKRRRLEGRVGPVSLDDEEGGREHEEQAVALMEAIRKGHSDARAHARARLLALRPSLSGRNLALFDRMLAGRTRASTSREPGYNALILALQRANPRKTPLKSTPRRKSVE